MAQQPNPTNSDGVLKHYVPVPSLDTPEEILEHYRQAWEAAMIRAARIRARMATVIHPRMPGYHAWKEAYAAEANAKLMFDLVRRVVESYRFSQGQGTLIPVEGRHGKHATTERDIPLTLPGYTHLWKEGNRHNILCEDDACAYEPAAKELQHTDCPACIKRFYRDKRNRKRKFIMRTSR